MVRSGPVRGPGPGPGPGPDRTGPDLGPGQHGTCFFTSEQISNELMKTDRQVADKTRVGLAHRAVRCRPLRMHVIHGIADEQKIGDADRYI